MSHQIIIAAGGTGGHLYPAQGLASELSQLEPKVHCIFAGSGLITSPYFDRTAYCFREIPSAPFAIKSPIKCMRSFSQWMKGVYASLQLIEQVKPLCVVGFGSYHSFPVLLAAKIKKIPIILHEANAVAGRVNRLFARYADCVGVFFPEALKKKKAGQVVLTDIPLRSNMTLDLSNKKEAYDYFELDSNKKTLLVFGGSQGALKINQAMINAAEHLQSLQSSLQILHFTGDTSYIKWLDQTYQGFNITHCIKPFENNMHLAWKIADGFISRAGASTIAEHLLFQVPGIFIPYRLAMDDHQEKNALFAVEQTKAALKLDENDLDPKLLAHHIQELLRDEAQMEYRLKLQAAKHANSRVKFSKIVHDRICSFHIR